MNLPPFLENKFKAAETVEKLKEAIVDILEEYDFGILSEHERRIEELEKITGKKENIQSGEDEKQELIIVGSAEEIGYVIYQILTKGKQEK